jgi:dTDP-4-amino-4,6-dideoxygalactose transaminase
VLTVKLRHLDGWIESRRAKAAFYDRRLAGIAGGGVATPPAEADRFHVYHLYTIRAARRDELKAHLAERGIGAGVYYPVCLHQQPCFSHLEYREGEFPGAERAAREVLSLPLFADLTTAELERVVAALEEFHTG